MRVSLDYYKSFFWLILFILLWATGCIIPYESNPIPPSPQTLITTATKTPQPFASTKTEKPLSTTKVTAKQSTSTPRLTSSRTPTEEISTKVLIQTLSLGDAKDLAIQLLRTNGDCRLPCWWGIIPGETRELEVHRFLDPLGNIITLNTYNDEGGYVGIHVPQNNMTLRSLLEYKTNKNDEVVELISLQIQGVYEPEYEIAYNDPIFKDLAQYYMLPQILSAYGRPSEVFVWANRFPWQLYLLLYYGKQGFMVNYIAPMTQIGEELSSCPAEAYIELWLWPPEREYSPAEVVSMKYGEGTGQDWFAQFLPLEEAASLNQDEFYAIFSDPDNTSCLDTPLDLWPEP